MIRVDTSELAALGTVYTIAGVRVGERAAMVVRRCGLMVQSRGSRLAPRDTGFLASTIGTDFVGDGRSGSMSAIVGPTADYGAHVEWGTYKMAAQPYMGPALAEVEPVFYAAMEQVAGSLGL